MTVTYLFYDNFKVSLLLLPYIPFYIKKIRKLEKEKEERDILNQFKDGMIGLSFALRVGYSVENSFKEAIGELILVYGEKSMIVKWFHKINNRVLNNENIEDILEDFAKDTNIEEISYFAEIFRYAKRTGGDLVNIIHNSAHAIREKVELRNEIQTMVSGKKYEQKIMSKIPYVIVLYLRLSAPEFVEPLYKNLVGIIIMSICLGLLMVCDWLSEKIVTIKI